MPNRELILIFVAFHPTSEEVHNLMKCLSCLPNEIGYAVAANDYRIGEAVDELFIKADFFMQNKENLGYGRAVNRLVKLLKVPPLYLSILNTDLTWNPDTFETMLSWAHGHPDVSLIVPQILDAAGQIQKLCKQHPTLLALLSRRFIPEFFKPRWLKHYDRWYVMNQYDYQSIFEVPYLSGCCMFVKYNTFLQVGGFDERYFLYLEDADLTRELSAAGRCLHFPMSSVNHSWGKGNYINLRLTLVNLISAWRYFCKWGWRIW